VATLLWDRRGTLWVRLSIILLLALSAPLHAQQPQQLRDLESQASAARSRGDAAAALAAWQQAAALDPNSARIQDEIGFLLAVLNRRDEAYSHFERALALENSSAVPHFDRLAFRTPRRIFATLAADGSDINFMGAE